MNFEAFRTLFIEYAGKTLTYLNQTLPDEPERAKDLFYRVFLKVLRIRNKKPELISNEQWLMFCIHGELRSYYKHMSLKKEDFKEKLKKENELLYEWINPFDEETQKIILQEAIEFYTDETFKQSFEETTDIFDILKKAKNYFEEKR